MMKDFEPPKNTLICSPKIFLKISKDESIAERVHSMALKMASVHGLSVRADYGCPETLGYLFDASGEMYKILFEP